MRFNISQLQDYVTCPQLAYIRHALNIGRAGGSLAQTEGSMFHLAMEDKLRRVTQRSPQELFAAVANPRPGAIEVWEKHQLSDVIAAWERPAEWQPHAIEAVLRAPLGHHEGEGRLDTIIKIDGYWWSEQHKTFADDLDAVLQRVRLSWHEAWYERLLEHNGFTPVGGTIINACQKLPSYRMVEDPATGKRRKVEVTQAMRRAALTTHFVSRTSAEQHHLLAGIARYVGEAAYDFANKAQHDIDLPRQTSSCWNFNNRCPFYSHCWEGEDLVPPNFIQLTPRYPTSVP